MIDSARDPNVTNLFIRSAHHKPCFVIFTQQNLFPRGQESKNRQLNTQYLVLMNNPRDRMQVSYLGRQMFPNSKQFLPMAYAEATAGPFSYLFLDLHQRCAEIARVRARILPTQKPMTTFVNKQLHGGITTTKYTKRLQHRKRLHHTF